MARGRILSPEFWTDSAMVRLSPFARLLYMGMWNHAFCDKGHMWDDPIDLKLKILPADSVDAEELLKELVASGRVARGSVDGRAFLSIPTFLRWQKADDARYVRKCPICQLCTPILGSALPSTTEHDNSRQLSHQERNGMERNRGEGTARGSRPPRYCPQHPTGTTEGCFACRDARIAQQEWDEAQKAPKRMYTPKKGDGHECKDVGSGYCVTCGERL